MGIAVFLLAGLFLGWWPVTKVPGTIVPGVSEGISFLAPFHPYLALEVALGKVHAAEPATVAHYGWPLRWMLARPDSAYMVMTIILSILLVTAATFFVRRGIKQGELPIWQRIWQARLGRGRETRRARRVWSNPVAWREAVTRASAASSNLVRYGYMAGGITAAAFVLWAYYTSRFNPTSSRANVDDARDWLTTIVIIEFVTVMLMAANTAATAITRERESDTMELLLTTPLTSKYIVWGKLRGLVSFTLPLLALPAGTVLVAALIDLMRLAGKPADSAAPIAEITTALLLPPLLLVYSAFACILSLQMSLKSKRSVQAVLSSVGILVVVGFGLGMCAFGLDSSSAQQLAALISPFTFVTAIWFVMNPGMLVDTTGVQMDLPTALVFLTMGTLISLAVYSAIVAGMYKSMVRNFDMIVRKQSR
jgi:ABC-type transport system involved in multi-copper enzyme maturation permease subunit